MTGVECRCIANLHAPDCPNCDARTRELVEGYRRDAAVTRAKSLSEIGPRFADRTFANFSPDEHNQDALAASLALTLGERTGLGLWGPCGVGKSHLAGAIVNSFIADNRPAAFVGVVDLLQRIRATYDPKKTENENDMVRRYATVPVLVIDDLGKESLSDWAVRILYALINRRYEQNLPLIVTANQDFEATFHRAVQHGAEQNTYSATIDRISEMTGLPWIHIGGATKRI
jgi:DNA replication protein DnaC